MSELHDELQRVSRQIKAAQEDILIAQGSNAKIIEQAEMKIQEVRDKLQLLQEKNGREAINHPQFQHAFEELHDVRQQIQEAQQNMNDLL